MDVEDQLRDAFARSVRGVDPPVHALVARAVREGRSSQRARRTGWGAGGLAAAAVVAAVVAAVAVTDPWSGDRSSTPGAAPCHAAVQDTVLPSWARTGFSDPEPVVPHVMGAEGRIVAILFARELHAPPARQVNNKVLWAARSPGAPLSIDAVRAGDGKVAHREIAAARGPSILDLPGAGCWHLTLDWGSTPDMHDTMDLEYVAPR